MKKPNALKFAPDIVNAEALHYAKRLADEIEGFEHDTQAQWLVTVAARAYQRGLEAAALIAKTGLLVKDRYGAKTKVNPACAVEQRSFATVIQTLRALNIQDPA